MPMETLARLRPKFQQSFSWVCMASRSMESVMGLPDMTKAAMKGRTPSTDGSTTRGVKPAGCPLRGKRRDRMGCLPAARTRSWRAMPAVDQRSGRLVSFSSILSVRSSGWIPAPMSQPSNSALAPWRTSSSSSAAYCRPSEFEEELFVDVYLGHTSYPLSARSWRGAAARSRCRG